MTRLLALSLWCFSSLALAYTPVPTYPLTTGPSTDGWQPDRYPPARFANAGTQFGRANVLRQGVAAADGPTVRPPPFNTSFYNYQGRRIFYVRPSGSYLRASLYIPTTWLSANPAGGELNRRAELWATLSPVANQTNDSCETCNVFPVIGFSNASTADPVNLGGAPRFRIFDAEAGGFLDLAGAPSGDRWHELVIVYKPGQVDYWLDDTRVYSDLTLIQTDPTLGPLAVLSRVTTQTYNHSHDYDALFADIAHGPVVDVALESCPAPMPAPGQGLICVRARNLSAASADGVVVTVFDTSGLPAPSLTSPVGSCSGLSCSLGTLAAGAQVELLLRATAPAGSYAVGSRIVSLDFEELRGNNVNRQSLVPSAPLILVVPTLDPIGLALLTLALLVMGATVMRRAI